MNSFWNKRKVFITGATGFVGAHIAKRLVESGSDVVCLQRDAICENSLDVFGLRGRLTVINGDLEDLPLMERILNEYEIDAVFHLAAQALVGAANRSPLSTFETNIRGTYLLLEACRRSSTVKRIVVASSDKAYGSHKTLPYMEDFPLQGRFPYDVSKTCTDLITQSFAITYGLPATITRSANIYGEGDLNRSRIIPGTIFSILSGEDPIIRSDGTPVREFIHVDDVVSGYLLLAEEIEKTAGSAYNFGTNEPVQMLDLVERILKLMNPEGKLRPHIMLKTKIDREIDEQYLSGEKFFTEFGWKPLISLDEGLRKTIEWYKNYRGRMIA
jgi:CDP-glucose 4,6-dehydratase